MTTSMSHLSPADIVSLRRTMPRAFGRPWRERLIIGLGWAVFAALVGFCLWRMEVTPERLWYGLGKLGWLLKFMFPPSSGGWLGEFAYAMLETVSMAFLGTFLATVAAIPLGFLGAKNVVPRFAWHFGLRRLFDGLRGIDSLIWALMFVNVVGLGPFAGIMAIAVSDAGTLAKLFAEAIENVDRRPIDGVRAAGANQLQLMRFAILPQVLPVMLSHALYYFESNTRSATILGVVGAGGIGMHLADRIRVNNWDEVSFILIMILVVVSVIDLLSRTIRLRIIHGTDADRPLWVLREWH